MEKTEVKNKNKNAFKQRGKIIYKRIKKREGGRGNEKEDGFKIK